MAGFFFAFSTCVMSALGRLPAPEGVAAMQAINVTVINPVFMTVMFGTALVCVASMAATLADWDGSYGAYLLAGGAVYLLGAVGVTMAANVPRNNTRARLDRAPRPHATGLATCPSRTPGTTSGPPPR